MGFNLNWGLISGFGVYGLKGFKGFNDFAN